MRATKASTLVVVVLLSIVSLALLGSSSGSRGRSAEREGEGGRRDGESGPSQGLKVLHITDVHLDLSYQVGASVLCTKPPCCRAGEKERNEAQVRLKPNLDIL